MQSNLTFLLLLTFSHCTNAANLPACHAYWRSVQSKQYFSLSATNCRWLTKQICWALIEFGKSLIRTSPIDDVESAPIFLLFEFAKLSLPMFHTPCGAPIFDHLLPLCIMRSLKLTALYDFWLFMYRTVSTDNLHLLMFPLWSPACDDGEEDAEEREIGRYGNWGWVGSVWAWHALRGGCIGLTLQLWHPW